MSPSQLAGPPGWFPSPLTLQPRVGLSHPRSQQGNEGTHGKEEEGALFWSTSAPSCFETPVLTGAVDDLPHDEERPHPGPLVAALQLGEEEGQHAVRERAGCGEPNQPVTDARRPRDGMPPRDLGRRHRIPSRASPRATWHTGGGRASPAATAAHEPGEPPHPTLCIQT